MGLACDPEGEDTTAEPAEETHVVLRGCEVELACEALTSRSENLTPASADECVQALVGDGLPGMVSVLQEVDGASHPPFREETYLLLADGGVLRQIRQRDCGSQESCESGPWEAWGPQERCDHSDYFYPDNYSGCAEVADWSCEEIAAAATP